MITRTYGTPRTGPVTITVNFHVRGTRAYIRALKRAVRALERIPQPLCIDGHEYRRRQRSRKKRARR